MFVFCFRFVFLGCSGTWVVIGYRLSYKAWGIKAWRLAGIVVVGFAGKDLGPI